MQAERVVRDVKARKARVRVVEYGEGPPLVMLHDYLFSHTQWLDVVPLLASRFRLVLPDLPGFGGSEKPDPERFPYTVEGLAETMVDLFAGLGIGRAHLCGVGLGAQVALTLAAIHPATVERLMLVAPAVYEGRTFSHARIVSTPVVGQLFFKQMYGRRLFFDHVRRVYDKKPDPARALDWFSSFDTPAARAAAYAIAMSAHDTRSIVARVPRVATSTLVLWGRDDTQAPLASGRRLARELRAERFEVLECGHSPPEEHPEAFARIALSFFARAEAA